MYSLFLWLPLFVSQDLGGTNTQAANIQTAYDIGGALGSILLGYFTDKLYSRRTPVILMSLTISTLISFIIAFGYQDFTATTWIFLMFILGFFIGNVNTFLVITCPADLGRAHSKQATATITGIIDGIGS